jgi:HlyD family secretion protein
MLENPASYEDMLVLMNWAASARHTLHAQADNWQPVPLPDGLSVGMVQDSYTSLQQRLFEYRVFIQDEYYTAKHQALHQQRTEYQQLEKTLTQQKSLVSEELNLTQKKLSRDSKLLKRGLLSPLEVEQSQATLLKKQYERASAQQALANNRIRLSELQRDLVDLEQQHAERARTLRLALLESYETLNNQLTVWQQTYLLQAPIAGRVSFFTTLHENQFVPASETVMAVVPDGGEIFGKVLLPQARSGKVKSGQRTRITLDSYPAAEFGTVEGLVEDISLVGQDQAYLIRITLPDGLRTRYSINLDFRQEMEGSAVIITEKIRLIERIFNWLHQALDRGIAP